MYFRLTVDALTRPTPKDMLSHPWIVHVMKQEVHMARWIRQVWGGYKPSRKSDGYVVNLLQTAYPRYLLVIERAYHDRVPAMVPGPSRVEQTPSILPTSTLTRHRKVMYN